MQRLLGANPVLAKLGQSFLGLYTSYEGAVRSLLTKAASTTTLD
jgi:hypothetical protein